MFSNVFTVVILYFFFLGELVSYHRNMPITKTGEELLLRPCNRTTNLPPLVFQGLLKTWILILIIILLFCWIINNIMFMYLILNKYYLLVSYNNFKNYILPKLYFVTCKNQYLKYLIMFLKIYHTKIFLLYNKYRFCYLLYL